MQPSSLIRSDDLRNENRRRLLDTLRAEGPCAPARVRALTGLSAASISMLSSQMVEQGILLSERYPTHLDKNLRGRPRSQLSLNPAAGHVLTIALTIDRIRIRLVDYAGKICATREQYLETRILDASQLLAVLCENIDELLSRHDAMRLRHIGVGFQGQTEHATGALLWSPIIRDHNIPLGAMLRQRYAVSISVNNDCRLIAQALSRSQAEVLGKTFATVLFSHGVGLGLYLNGQPFAGTRSSAMEIGHLRYKSGGALCRCGRRGCIEAYAADYGIERLAKAQPIDQEPAGRVTEASMDLLIAAAQAGEQTTVEAFVTAGKAVGEGLVNLFTLFDPMPVALVGHNDEAFDLMRTGIHAILDSHLPDGPEASELLHRFAQDDPLLSQGLIDNSLNQVDRLFADQKTDIDLTG
ncbi:ROK family protein [Granulosicoccus antarcticus]|uniref:N-acetylglucosamine repressor n=1 Tax=Granulosicoccus antarcticus IMCC3135 TaxID=1192854 RepID=A0A2Z2NWG0_9GAMM|nr:ROK family protein [Granulosicoccus antarcticus]ASJ74391.1 N-acetylglucosamine repressor [Granulosicoccus antarcticus IMCC3135]